MTPELQSTAIQALSPDPVEKAASFGRWWHHAESDQYVLSAVAASMLGATAGWHATPESCFVQVMPDDALRLMSALVTAGSAAD